MKTKLNKIYQQYFSEIMTGILASLVIITGLLIFGIYKGTVQRNEMQEGQNILLNNDTVAIKLRNEFKVKQDKALKSSYELMDLMKKQNGRSTK